MNQPAKIRRLRLEGQEAQLEQARLSRRGDVAIAESLQDRLPTIDDWLDSKRTELEQAFISINLADEGAIVRIAAVQAQQAILRELTDMMLVVEETKDV